MRSVLLGFSVCLALAPGIGWAGARLGCEDHALLEATLGPKDFDTLPAWLGTLELPISLSNPTPMKAAQVRLDLVQDATQTDLQLYFTFFDPQHPVGIPYSFEAIEMDWETELASGHASLDLTQGCTSVGPSIFPGQSLPVRMKLENWHVESRLLKLLRIRIWGNRG